MPSEQILKGWGMDDNYPYIQLGTLVSVQGGFAFKSADFTDSGIPVLKIKNVRLRDVETTELAYVTQSVAKNAARYYCKTGDILISMTGSGPQAPKSAVGRVARFTGPSDCYLINQRVGRFVIKDTTRVDRRFLFFVLTQQEVLWKLVSIATGSANQANISGSQIESLYIPVPPLSRQEAIAYILGCLDDKIELNRRMNDTLEAMAYALFKSWFIDFDPVRMKADGGKVKGMDEQTASLFPNKFEDSALGKIPYGWKAEALEKHFEVTKGLSYKGSGLATAGMLMHNLNSVYEGGGYKYEGVKYYDGEFKERHKLSPGDVIVTNTEQGFQYLLIGYPAIVPKCFGPVGLFSHHIFRVRALPGSPLSNTLAYLFLRFDARLRDEVTGYTNGTTVNMLSADGLKRPLIPVPPRLLVQKFEAAVKPMLQRFEANIDESRALSATRDSLLPKLLSGEICIKDADRFVEATA